MTALTNTASAAGAARIGGVPEMTRAECSPGVRARVNVPRSAFNGLEVQIRGGTRWISDLLEVRIVTTEGPHIGTLWLYPEEMEKLEDSRA
jgi:hypothetical protein